MNDRRDETQPSMQSENQQNWLTIYRESGLACANYPAYPAAGTDYNTHADQD